MKTYKDSNGNLFGNIFFTSDTHFWHGNIIKYCNRPFLSQSDADFLRFYGNWSVPEAKYHRIDHESIDLMNKNLVYNINKIVSKDDILIHAGDYGMYHYKDKDYYRRCRDIRDKINCDRIYFIRGNHDDKCIDNLFQDVHELWHTKINGVDFSICHYAMLTWDKSHKKDNGAINIYGHSHSEIEQWADQIMPGRKSMDIGVDNINKLFGCYRPISFNEIMNIMNSKKGFCNHHTEHGLVQHDSSRHWREI